MVRGWYRHVEPSKIKKFLLERLEESSPKERAYSAAHFVLSTMAVMFAGFIPIMMMVEVAL